MVDLSKCKKGDQLKTQDGRTVIFDRASSNKTTYYVTYPDGINTDVYNDGRRMMYTTSEGDIIEILTKHTMAIDLTNAKVGDEFILRDGKRVKYESVPHKENKDIHRLIYEDGTFLHLFENGRSNRTLERPSDIVEVVAKKDATLPTSPKERYLSEQKASGITIGNYVKVLFCVPDNSRGWINYWNYQMDETARQRRVLQVVDIHGNEGIALSDGCEYPYFCLEVVKAPPANVKLTTAWTAEVIDKDTIRVGCQTFNRKALDELIKAAKASSVIQLNSTTEAKVVTTVSVRNEHIPLDALLKLVEEINKLNTK